MGKKSRDKGKAGEREVAKLLRDYGFEAKRGVQYKGGADSPDVVHSIPGIHIEVKRAEKFALWDAMKQAASEAKEGDYPIVFHRKNDKPWVVVLDAGQFLAILRAFLR